MKQSNEFDWREFNNLADSYIEQNNESKQRTGVSRYYYGTFCTTRDFLNENDIYLNEKSKKTMQSKKSDVHGETSKIFRKHEKFKKNNIGKTISKELDKLRKMRNEADYEKITSDSLDNLMLKSKIKSERILELLDEIN
ncbi:hypothetical protein [Methanobrevibacter sp.]|uniref:hypothetical protein n=1 Tax=Methanobrevibacter sp. TaxID=66852 RepID=UPI0038677F9D